MLTMNLVWFLMKKKPHQTTMRMMTAAVATVPSEILCRGWLVEKLMVPHPLVLMLPLLPLWGHRHQCQTYKHLLLCQALQLWLRPCLCTRRYQRIAQGKYLSGNKCKDILKKMLSNNLLWLWEKERNLHLPLISLTNGQPRLASATCRPGENCHSSSENLGWCLTVFVEFSPACTTRCQKANLGYKLTGCTCTEMFLFLFVGLIGLTQPPQTLQLVPWAVVIHVQCKMKTVTTWCILCQTLPLQKEPGKSWLQMQKVKALLYLERLHHLGHPQILCLPLRNRVCSPTVLKLYWVRHKCI